MHIILLSGGSGKRLWPLSNDIRSKQFIRFFKREDGEYESMVQRMYRQIREVDPQAHVTIATSKAQVSSIHNQLGSEVSVCVEPCRRDTFPAIALASVYLHDVKKVSKSESVVVCPVDPYVEKDYFAAVKKLGVLAAQGEANLVLMGMEPTYPSEKYGYVIPETRETVSRVATFREKPDRESAARYIRQGALWNGGVFAYKLGYMLERPMSCWRLRTMRISCPGTIPCTGSASTMRWQRRRSGSASCALTGTGRIWEPGTPSPRLWRSPAWAGQCSMKPARTSTW